MTKIAHCGTSIIPVCGGPGPRTRAAGRPGPRRTAVRTLCAALLAVGTGQVTQAAPGDLDPSFDADGRVLSNLSHSENALALVAQPDGKLVAAGFSGEGLDTDFALARYNPNGGLDTSFGEGGVVRTLLGPPNNFALALGLLRQADGKLVAAGLSVVDGTRFFDFTLVRYNPDGSLDSGFGQGGVVHTDFSAPIEAALGVVQQSDGKLVAAGLSGFCISACATASPVFDIDFAFARYNPNGSLDTTFNNGGRTIVNFGGPLDGAAAVVLQPDERIVAAGQSNRDGTDDFALVRLNPDGRLDTSFGRLGGRALIPFGDGATDGANALVIQPDNKLVAGGVSNDAGDFDFALVRLNPNGRLDTSFGLLGGGALISFGTGRVESARALTIQPDGKLVAGGFSQSGSDFDFALARFNPDGGLDASFGPLGGRTLTPFSAGSIDSAVALAIAPDGKLVAAGGSNAGGDFDFALARYFLVDEPPPVVRRCAGRPVTIMGTSRGETIRGTDGPDVILGLGGRDTIRGRGGNDVICGGVGNDRLVGGEGTDHLLGGRGNDRLFGDAGRDRMDGGSGTDRCRGRGDARKNCERLGAPRPEDPRIPLLACPPVANVPGCRLAGNSASASVRSVISSMMRARP